MNSFYGKFGQSTSKNSHKTEYITESEQLRKLLNDPNNVVNFIHFINVSKNFFKKNINFVN
jgi:hypothetical protein